MRTTRLLTVSQHALHRVCLPRGVSACGGCLPGVSAQGVSVQGGLSASGPMGCLPLGVYLSMQ